MARVTGSLTTAGNTVEISVSAASRVTLYFSGASYSVSLAFEGSDGTNWSPLAFTVGHASSPSGIISVSLSNTDGNRSYHVERPGVIAARVRAVSVTGQLDVVAETYYVGVEADVVDAVQIQGETQLNFAISTSGAQAGSGVAAAGIYDFSSDVDCFLKIAAAAGTASDVTTSTGEPLYAGNVVPHRMAVNDRPGAITASGSGTLRYIRTHA